MKVITKCNTPIFFAVLFSLIAGQAVAQISPDANNILYVNQNVSGGTQSGDSWANAIPELRTALTWAADEWDGSNPPLQIWVATGVYTPTDSSADRTAAFQLVNNVEIFGGFAGTEEDLNDRNREAYPTVLSGNIVDPPSDPADAVEDAGSLGSFSYHVVTGSGTDATAILDGFTVTGGNANAVTGPNGLGGGMYNSSGSPTLTNVTFSGNSADGQGGGMYNFGSSPVLTNVTFSGNSAESTGGGMYNVGSSPVLTNVTFSGNSAESGGGGMHNVGGSPVLTNVTFSGNSAGTGGGGMLNEFFSSPVLTNVIIWNNRAGGSTTTASASILNIGSFPAISFSLIADSGGSGSWNPAIGSDGGGNIDTDPGLFPGGEDDPEDLDGLSRFYNDTIDMGAYEFQGATPPITPDANNILYVAQNVSGGIQNGDSWANAIPELRDALAWIADEWDTSGPTLQIWVAEGLYTPTDIFFGVLATFRLFDNVEIYGGFAGTEDNLNQRDWENNPTVLSGDIDGDDEPFDPETDSDNDPGTFPQTDHIRGHNSLHVVTGSGTGSAAILNGFTITGGNSIGDEVYGGGMINENGSPTLANLTFSGNLGGLISGGGKGGGGAMFNGSGSSPTLTNVTFYGNASTQFAVMLNENNSNPILTDVTFSGNAGWAQGGGMTNYRSSPVLTNVIFSGNVTLEHGGGMYNRNNSSPVLTNVIFSGNTANVGGGMYNESSSPVLTNVTFSGNTAGSDGGGMNNFRSSPVLTNVTFSGNTAGSDGGGMYNRTDSAPVLTNVIMWGNQSEGSNLSASASIFNNSSTPAISFSLIANSGGSGSWDPALGTNGGNNIDADPEFLSTTPGEAGYLHLNNTSPAINAGDPATNLSLFPGGPDNPLDLAGNPRVFAGSTQIIDIGAYEFQQNAATLDLAKSFAGVAIPGGTVSLEFTITNNTSQPLGGLAFTDDLNAALSGLEAMGLPATDICGAGSQIAGTSVLTFTGGSVPAGALCTFEVTLQIPAGAEADTYQNITSELSVNDVPVAEPASADLEVGEPVTAGNGRVLAGSLNGYTFKPADFSLSDPQAAVIVKTLPANGDLEFNGSGVSPDDELSVGDIDDGKLTYAPTGGGHGTNYDSFDFTVKESGTESDTYTITIDVGAATMELTGTEGTSGEGWRFMTNPSDGDSYEDLLGPVWTKGVPGSDSPGATFPNVYLLNQEEYQWEAPADLNNTTKPGQPFIVYVFADDNNDGTPEGFPKILTSGQNWLPLDGTFSYNGLGYDQSAENPDSHFLIANPHPISIDFCEMYNASANVANSIDVWDPGANGGNGDYVNLSCSIGDVFIAPFQGFWVRTTDTNPVLEIPQAAYLGSTEEGYFKQPNNERSAMSQKDIADLGQNQEDLTGLANLSGLALTVQSADGIFTNTARILFSEQATTGLDAFDALKLSPAGLAERWLSFHSLDEDNRGYALQNLPSEALAEDRKISIPLDIQTTEAGKFTLNWLLPESSEFAGSYYLRDNRTGEVMELREGAGYRFEVAPDQTSRVSETMEVLETAAAPLTQTEPRFELLVTAPGVDGLAGLGDLPNEFTLNQNYPNPFNPGTIISYELPQTGQVRLDVYDMTGRHVARLVGGQVSAGRHQVSFDAGNLSSGVYIYRLQAGGQFLTRQLTLIK